jgi:hypothetical protein
MDLLNRIEPKPEEETRVVYRILKRRCEKEREKERPCCVILSRVGEC